MYNRIFTVFNRFVSYSPFSLGPHHTTCKPYRRVSFTPTVYMLVYPQSLEWTKQDLKQTWFHHLLRHPQEIRLWLQLCLLKKDRFCRRSGIRVRSSILLTQGLCKYFFYFFSIMILLKVFRKFIVKITKNYVASEFNGKNTRKLLIIGGLQT